MTVLRDFIVNAAPGMTTTHATLLGVNLGVTLWMTTVDMAIIVTSTGSALKLVWANRWSTPAIVCLMSVLIAIGQLTFSALRIWRLIISDPIIAAQPDYAIVAVIVGSGFITAALVVGIIWRAAKFRPGTGRKVAYLNIALASLCLLGGGFIAA